MAKSGIEFKIRKWTDSPRETMQYDVVALDYDNNKQHFHPDDAVKFSTPDKAQLYADSLNARNKDTGCMNFVRDHWPVDGGIE
jgi:hypothetical protein